MQRTRIEEEGVVGNGRWRKEVKSRRRRRKEVGRKGGKGNEARGEARVGFALEEEEDRRRRGLFRLPLLVRSIVFAEYVGEVKRVCKE